MRQLIAVALLCAGLFCIAQAQVTQTGAGLGAPSSGGGTVTWTATGNPTAQDTGTSSATFSSVAIGTPAASDIIVAIFTSTTTVASSLTCNSNGMTKQAQESSIQSGLQLWSITASACGVTGGSTTTFVASAGGNMNQEFLLVGKMSGPSSSTPGDTGTSTSTSIAVTVPSSGIAVIGAYASGTGSPTWTGGTQDYNNTNGSNSAFLVHASATGTVSQGTFSSSNIHFVYAAWGP